MGLILVTIDSLRLDDMAHINLPGAQAFPCVSVAPITSVACASIMTGLYPPRHGLRNLTGYKLRDNVATLAGLFKAAGYSTHAVVSGPPLKRFSGLDRDFDTYDDNFKDFKRPKEEVFKAAPKLDTQKIFLWLHFFDLHPPMLVNGDSLAAVFRARHRELDKIMSTIQFVSRQHLQHRMILTSDHGEGFCWRVKPTMWLGHGERLDDVDVNVPLFLCRFKDCWHPWALRQVDILPTVCREFGLPVPEDLDGVAAQDQTEELWAYSESYLRPFRAFPNLRSIRRGLDLLVIGDNVFSYRPAEHAKKMYGILTKISKPPDGADGDGLNPQERKRLESQLKSLGYI